jgi:hypothetical protein
MVRGVMANARGSESEFGVRAQRAKKAVIELANARLAEWASFYVIVGSSGAALIGMQFVVMTLIANMRVRPPLESLHAFGTPTVVQLTGALLVSAIMSAPWPSLVLVALTVGMCGLGGMAYGAIVIRRARRHPARLVRHRRRGARSAPHRHPQCVGYSDPHGDHALRGARLRLAQLLPTPKCACA